jgi:hypothetical protein
VISKTRVLACAGMSAMLLWPASASAQHGHPGPAHGHVVVSAGFYYPYYYHPYVYPFYSPFYFGFGAFYNSVYGWYPYYAGYPAPYPPYYYSGYWASARIEVKPRDAQVYLDGYYVGVVDQFDGVFQRLDIPPGQHELTVYMPGFHTITERTLFRSGQTYHFKETLQALPAGSTPEPKPQPDPNAVQQNAPPPPYGQQPLYGQPPPPYGQPPPAYGQPPPYGQEPYPQQPPPPPAQGGEPRMEPVPPRSPQNRGELGTLNLRVQPEDAIVTIDGERWDSPQGGSRLVVQLAPGAHRIEVRKDGFRTYTSTVQILPGQPQTINVSLPPGN